MLLPGFGALGAVQLAVDCEPARAFERGVKSVGSGILLQRRQKVFRYHHGGAAGLGGGPAPVAAGCLYLRQAGGLQKKLGVRLLSDCQPFTALWMISRISTRRCGA